jgi:transposase
MNLHARKGMATLLWSLAHRKKAMFWMFCPIESVKRLKKWRDRLSVEQRQAIKVVNVDMWEPYTLAVTAKLPQATIVVDRFHVMKNMNHCLTQARREIQNQASDKVKAQLKGSRWVLVKNQNDFIK